MKIGILTNEYPPHVYGGAGVHVEYLARELARLENKKHEVKILCFGQQKEHAGNLTVEGVQPTLKLPFQDKRHEKFKDTLLRNIIMAGSLKDVDIVHCHTWYTHFAGCLCQQLHGVPLVLTTHSLEPHRPWKVEQLGTAYHASTWLEKTAYENADGVIAVSHSMGQDVQDLYGVKKENVRVIHNGIDLNQYQPTPNPEVLKAYGIKLEKPFILFVGRITRQKGIIHLVNAIKYFSPGMQIVLCAGAPDTKEIGIEMSEAVERAKKETQDEVIWIAEMVSKEKVISLYSHASVFVCPSVYEPFGIINLEAMACNTPVVGAAVGGILEVVVPDETGLLVPFENLGATNFEPKDPDKYSRDLAAAVNSLMSSPDKLKSMGIKSRERVEKYFSWTSIAQRTLDYYGELIKRHSSGPPKN